MYIFATFQHSMFLELAITAIEQEGVSKENILAVPLHKRKEARKIFDTLHRADGISMVDLSAILGTCFMLLGAIYGYELEWGPIIWGIIGALFGIAIGFLIRWAQYKHKGISQDTGRPDVVLLIRCERTEQRRIEELLWDHHALGVGPFQLK